MASVNRPYCIDAYHGDSIIGENDEGFAQVKALGIAFLDHKASEGVSSRQWDPLCKVRRSKWMVDGTIQVVDVDGTAMLLVPQFGFYHFNGTGAATDEAANFKAATLAAGYQVGDDLCLDWEDIGASGYQQPASWADDFCKATEDWCQFSIKVYGGDAPREQLLKASSTIVDNFSARRLWFCEYGSYRPDQVPLPWQHSGPYQWQDDGDNAGPGPHTIAGISGYIDNSTVVGAMTVAQMATQWGSPLSANVPSA